MLICDSGLLLQLPHEHVDQMRVFNYNRHFFEHVLKGDTRLLQSVKHVKNALVWWSGVFNLTVSYVLPNPRPSPGSLLPQYSLKNATGTDTVSFTEKFINQVI